MIQMQLSDLISSHIITLNTLNQPDCWSEHRSGLLNPNAADNRHGYAEIIPISPSRADVPITFTLCAVSPPLSPHYHI